MARPGAALDSADEAGNDEDLGEAEGLEDEEEDEEEPERRTTPATSAADSRPTGRRARNRDAAKVAQAAPSVSEQAVKIHDRASAVFVLGLVAVFAVILGNGMLGGNGGFLTDMLATPTPLITSAPVTASPVAVPSVDPVASASASAEASAAASAAAAARPGRRPRPHSAPASPAPSPSLGPSPSPTAS